MARDSNIPPHDSRLTRFSPSEKLVYLLLDGDWTLGQLRTRVTKFFHSNQQWPLQFVEQLVESFPDRPTVGELLDYLPTNEVANQALKKRRNQKRLKQWFVSPPSLNWLDWQLPRFDSEAALASHVGVPLDTLDWLCEIDRPISSTTDHYVRTWLQKKQIGQRLIESPKPKLKTVQRILLQDILNWIPLTDAVTGFRVGHSVVDFVRPHVGKPFCLRMDMKDFFPSINAHRVSGFFRHCGYGRSIVRRLTRLTTTETPLSVLEPHRPIGCRGSFELSRLYLPGHLPQGAPTSPMLANHIAFGLDRRLSGLANAMGINYTRYADDLLFSGERIFKRQAKRFAETVGAIALEEGFQINFHKTKFLGPSQRIRVAGIVINEKINLPRKDFQRLKATLHNCVRHGVASQNLNGVKDFRAHLQGRINWARQLNPQKAEQLQRLFDQIQWEGDDSRNA